MKKCISYFAMILCSIALLSSCSNTTGNEQQQEQENVNVTFIYTLDTSNGSSMSRAITNAEVFNEFYAKITSGELVAPSYNLTLTEVTTGTVYTFNGKWDSHDFVTLRTGTYNIVGESKAEGENIQEKCSFTFNEQIEINAESSTITLHANYDCFLLIFNNSQIESLENNNGSAQSSFYTFETYKYAFVNDKLFVEEQKNNAYISGKYTNNTKFKIFTGNLNFEKGKYYVYNSVSNGFDVPPMEEGGDTNQSLDGFGNIAEAIDLGLSVKWASWNIGASSPEECGLYFCWAGLEPRIIISNITYDGPYQTGYDLWSKYTTLTQYSHNGTIDNKTTLELQDDVAYNKWGQGWRIPSLEEFEELIDNCEWSWTEIKGIKGYLVTGNTGNSIFIPESGNSMWEESIIFDGITTLWANSLCTSISDNFINALYFTETSVYTRNIGRTDISAIRPVFYE